MPLLVLIRSQQIYKHEPNGQLFGWLIESGTLPMPPAVTARTS